MANRAVTAESLERAVYKFAFILEGGYWKLWSTERTKIGKFVLFRKMYLSRHKQKGSLYHGNVITKYNYYLLKNRNSQNCIDSVFLLFGVFLSGCQNACI